MRRIYIKIRKNKQKKKRKFYGKGHMYSGIRNFVKNFKLF